LDISADNPSQLSSSISTPEVPSDKVLLKRGNDIENFVGVYTKHSRDELRKILTDCWTPPESHTFPVVTIGQQNRAFQHQWLKTYKWLAYSESAEGAFCKWCVAFAPEIVSRNPTGHLVSCAFKNYKKAKEKLDHHQSCKYHQMTAEMYENFMKADKGENQT